MPLHLLPLLTTAASLGAALGVDHAEIRRTVGIAAAKSAGDFGDLSQLPGEIGDIRVSISHLAAAIGIDDDALCVCHDTGVESAASIVAWCDAHYPGEDTTQRVRNLIEEITEAGAALSIMVDDLQRAVGDVPASSDPSGVLRALRHLTAALAGSHGIDEAAALDAKMARNRARTLDESAARRARKQALGLCGGHDC